jgi:hypothetical protein
VFQLAPMKQLTLILLLTQPSFKCALTGGSGCTLTIGAAGCTLTIGAAKCTPTLGAAGCTLTVRAAGRGLVGAGVVLGLCPHSSGFARLKTNRQIEMQHAFYIVSQYAYYTYNMNVAQISILHLT